MTHFVTTFSIRFNQPQFFRGIALDATTNHREASLFSVAVDQAGRVTATAFGPAELLETRASLGTCAHDQTRTAAAREQIEAYFAGDLQVFSLPLAPTGSAFQLRVWEALQAIPYGETRSYGALARQLASSPRAVGRANATNPICLVIPCHRVIGADGSLTGFAFGEEVKRQLLEHEANYRESASLHEALPFPAAVR